MRKRYKNTRQASHARQHAHYGHSSLRSGSHAGRRPRSRATKIEKALELLNGAADEKREQVIDLLENQYSNVHDMLNEAARNGQSKVVKIKKIAGTAVRQARRKTDGVIRAGEQKVRKTANSVDRKIHDSPWLFLGLVALGSFMLGTTAHRRASEEEQIVNAA